MKRFEKAYGVHIVLKAHPSIEGLSGEIRPVSRILQRISEAERLGFQRIIIPNANLQGLDTRQFSIDVRPVRKVEEALRELFG